MDAFTLTLTASGNLVPDVECALEEALRLVREGFTSAQGENENGSFSFELKMNGFHPHGSSARP